MARLRVLFLAVGLILLGVVIHHADMGAVLEQVRAVGWGVLPVLLVFALAYLVDTVSWSYTLPRPRTATWVRRLWVVRIVGGAISKVTPLLGLGGEPVKAMMLKRGDGIPYRTTASSLIAWETTNMLGSVVFAGSGLFAAMALDLLPPESHGAALAGLAVLVFAAVGFLAFQRLRGFSRLLRPVSRWVGGRRLLRMLRHLRDIEAQLHAFYAGGGGRMRKVFVFSLVHQALLALEVWLTMRLLGTPVSAVGAWAITAVAEIIRVGTFFIPANLGTQEGGLTLMAAALTGNPTAGLSLAIVRRFRDLIFILWGLLLGWHGGIRARAPEAERDETEALHP